MAMASGDAFYMTHRHLRDPCTQDRAVGRDILLADVFFFVLFVHTNAGRFPYIALRDARAEADQPHTGCKCSLTY